MDVEKLTTRDIMKTLLKFMTDNFYTTADHDEGVFFKDDRAGNGNPLVWNPEICKLLKNKDKISKEQCPVAGYTELHDDCDTVHCYYGCCPFKNTARKIKLSSPPAGFQPKSPAFKQARIITPTLLLPSTAELIAMELGIGQPRKSRSIVLVKKCGKARWIVKQELVPMEDDSQVYLYEIDQSDCNESCDSYYRCAGTYACGYLLREDEIEHLDAMIKGSTSPLLRIRGTDKYYKKLDDGTLLFVEPEAPALNPNRRTTEFDPITKSDFAEYKKKKAEMLQFVNNQKDEENGEN